MNYNISSLKKNIREKVWKILEEKGVALPPKPIRNRIPNFIGAKEAAENLFKLEIWKKARIVKSNPDSPQRWIREAALRDGKILLMATPRLKKGFLLLDPRILPRYLFKAASTIKGAFQLGRIISLEELAKIGSIDLIVTGSVAVDTHGNRLGKGEGYAEIEYGVLAELGLVSENTPIATTVHDLQIVNYIPTDPYDLKLDYIVTPTRVIKIQINKKARPKGIYWDLLPCKKLEEIPLLYILAKHKNVINKCSNK